MLAGSLDTNVLLRLLLGDIPEQRAAVKKLIESDDRRFLVADTAIIEMIFVLDRYYQYTRQQIVEAIVPLISAPYFYCNTAVIEEALYVFARHPALSFEDSYLNSFAVNRDAMPLYTFDRKLAAQASGAQLISL